MDLALLGYSDNGESTLGLLFVDRVFECYTLEDEEQLAKVPGDTRIPDGVYEIKFRRVESGLTKKYRSRFAWFTWHLELQDVPGFSYVYIHVGNDDDDTDACILVGDTANNNQHYSGFIGQSADAYRRLYEKVSSKLNAGERVFIDIRRYSRFAVGGAGQQSEEKGNG